MVNKYEEVDKYFIEKLVEEEDYLKKALLNNKINGLPPHDVSPSQGQFLKLLTKISKTKRILEIGTLGGYSTLWFASGLPKDGTVITLEFSDLHSQVAQENFDNSPFSGKIELLYGSAAESLTKLIAMGSEPFDLIFIDADKGNNPLYLNLCMKLSKPGTIIIGDNVVRDGAILEKNSEDERVIGIQKFLDIMSNSEHMVSTAVETVGIKGYDGFTMSLVTSIKKIKDI